MKAKVSPTSDSDSERIYLTGTQEYARRPKRKVIFSSGALLVRFVCRVIRVLLYEYVGHWYYNVLYVGIGEMAYKGDFLARSTRAHPKKGGRDLDNDSGSTR